MAGRGRAGLAGVGVATGLAARPVTQRARADRRAVRCPSCEASRGLDSSASTAVAIRDAVAARVRPGRADRDRSTAFLVSRYGPGDPAAPPGSRLDGVGVGAAAGGAGARRRPRPGVVCLWRRRAGHGGRRRPTTAPSWTGPWRTRGTRPSAAAGRQTAVRRPVSAGRVRLDSTTRTFLLDSLEDLERASGLRATCPRPTTPTLRDRYTRARVLPKRSGPRPGRARRRSPSTRAGSPAVGTRRRALPRGRPTAQTPAAGPPASAGRHGGREGWPPWWRRWSSGRRAAWTAPRLPGQTPTGTVDLSHAAQIRPATLAQATTLEADGSGAGGAASSTTRCWPRTPPGSSRRSPRRAGSSARPASRPSTVVLARARALEQEAVQRRAGGLRPPPLPRVDAPAEGDHDRRVAPVPGALPQPTGPPRVPRSVRRPAGHRQARSDTSGAARPVRRAAAG